MGRAGALREGRWCHRWSTFPLLHPQLPSPTRAAVKAPGAAMFLLPPSAPPLTVLAGEGRAPRRSPRPRAAGLVGAWHSGGRSPQAPIALLAGANRELQLPVGGAAGVHVSKMQLRCGQCLDGPAGQASRAWALRGRKRKLATSVHVSKMQLRCGQCLDGPAGQASRAWALRGRKRKLATSEKAQAARPAEACSSLWPAVCRRRVCRLWLSRACYLDLDSTLSAAVTFLRLL
ncbi:hypothetical protein H920_03139 [Fukomys damarensis]|uniref:Uncharacterized protein n=1 Tax=Fukomys damarensis TaxID=885580 RepID=A0A091DTN3_FUKDA|nr:hypothetical protein H920_03139 [Fukomys damarensis]